jgi:hypothetical protein
MYLDKSSPTVAIHSVFTVRLDPKVVRYAKEMYPELDEFQWKDDCLYTIMLKAMYGCVQASALWYALI